MGKRKHKSGRTGAWEIHLHAIVDLVMDICVDDPDARLASLTDRSTRS